MRVPPRATAILGALLVILAVGVTVGIGQMRGDPGGWRDDFNGPLDSSAWLAYHNTYGDGNHELACLQPENVRTVDGELVITALRQSAVCPNGSVRRFTSGFIGSGDVGRYYPRYGRFEMRARAPHGQGLWPAFWLRHADGSRTGEVDVLELFHSQLPGQASQTLHIDGTSTSTHTPLEAVSPAGGWHTYAVEISPDGSGATVQFEIDGRPTGRHRIPPEAGALHGDPQHTWDIAINLAVGGDWVGDPDGTLGELVGVQRCAQGAGLLGACPDAGILRAEFPSEYRIDYVSYEPL